MLFTRPLKHLLGNIPIKSKLSILTMFVCGLTALFLSGAFIVNDIINVRQRLVKELTLASEIVGERTASRIAFQQADNAASDLKALSHKPSILLACLYTKAGNLFAQYSATDSPIKLCPGLPEFGHRFTANSLVMHNKIIDNRYSDSGSIYVMSDLRDVYQRINLSIMIIFCVVSLVMVIAYLVAGGLQRIILTPILDLVATTRSVAQGGKYSMRATKYYHDEIGELFDSFNHMMAEIEDANNNLEKKVKERTYQLEQAKLRAESSNKAKTEFLRNMSHEFRTPLHAINSFSIYGTKEAETAERSELQKYFSRILSGTNRLLKLVDGLLSLAKLESGQEIFLMEKGNLRAIVDVVLAEEQALIKDKQVMIEVIPPTISTEAIFDNDKMIQVITNIMGNALKFTPPGKKIILGFGQTVQPDPKNPGGFIPCLSLSISDQGIGIPENELDKIFDKFVQSSRTNTGAGGTGLGLAIAKNIMTGHDGTIIVQNNNNMPGATFVIILPYLAPVGKKVVNFAPTDDHYSTTATS
jgi:signal transduction histidine kinase